MSLLDPAGWPAHEIARSLDRGQRLEGYSPASGRATRGAVVGSTGPFAQYCGKKVLEAGGTSVDAAVATSCAQIALATGCWVSYAGIFTMVHYDAASGDVSALTAPFKTFAGETEPTTIPKTGTPSGRTALVPGFFAGAKAAHERFGRFSWADVLTPATWIAERGFPVDAFLARTMRQRESVITRTPEGRQVFLGDRGRLPEEGEIFQQPALAETLRTIAKEGPAHLYTGAWGERFVDVVTREGGKAALSDLSSYEPVWGPPARGTFNGHDVYGATPPSWGGAAVVEALHMVEELGLGDPQVDPNALRWFVLLCRQGQMLSQLPQELRVDRAHARRVVEAMRSAGGPVQPGLVMPTSHSDFVVTADAEGNVTAVCHSINCVMWGTSGLFVDGVSVPDAASFQQALLSVIPPGDLLPTPPEPTIVLKDGKVVLASSSIGAGLHEVTVQAMAAVLSGHDDIAAACERPFFHGPDYVSGDSINSGAADVAEGQTGIDAKKVDEMVQTIDRLVAEELAAGTPPEELMVRIGDRSAQVVEEGADPAVVEAAQSDRLLLVQVPGTHPRVPRGHWGGIQAQPDGSWLAARTPYAGGAVEVL